MQLPDYHAPHIVENSNHITEEQAKIYDLRDVFPHADFKSEENYLNRWYQVK